MAKNIKTAPVERRKFRNFLIKAQEYYESMGLLFASGKRSAAASAGIHCAILAADACLIVAAGVKCRSKRHLDQVDLIEQLSFSGAAGAARHLERVLNVKSYVEYTGDAFSAAEAAQIVKHVERFWQWVRSAVPV